jgi:hypothetical protein
VARDRVDVAKIFLDVEIGPLVRPAVGHQPLGKGRDVVRQPNHHIGIEACLGDRLVEKVHDVRRRSRTLNRVHELKRARAPERISLPQRWQRFPPIPLPDCEI